MSIDLQKKKKNDFTLTKKKKKGKKQSISCRIYNRDFTGNLLLLVYAPTQAKFLLHCQEQAVETIDL